MSEHILQADWVRYFNGSMPDTEKLSLLRHCAACEACDNLRRAGQDLQFALRHQQRRTADLSPQEEQAYRAVASHGAEKVSREKSGTLSVDLIREGEGYIFSDDTLEASGWGNRYALNLSPDGKNYQDDGGALSLAVEENRITVTLKDPAVWALVELLSDSYGEQSAMLLPDAVLPLPEKGMCRLRVIFEEE